MRLITAKVPESWQNLQYEVARVLEECGFAVEIEKEISTARGKVKIDVYAEETVRGRKYSIACECKRWKTRVPQTVIHSFRTVLDDLGVNVGYLISSRGFQSGAYQASLQTTAKLVTWETFQDAFCETWLETHLSPRISKELDPLFSYTEPLVPNWFLKVPDDEVAVLRGLREKYEEFGLLMMSLAHFSILRRTQGFPNLPLRQNFTRPFVDIEAIPDRILDAVGYRDFLDEALSHGKKAVENFRKVKRRNNL